MTIPIAHCQICARGILAKTGFIAHHGYKRPGHGWQTRSCMGARYRPYEVACDALPPAIEAVTAHIASTEALLAEWQATPPQAIYCRREQRCRRFADIYQVEWSALRPVDFERAAPLPAEKNQAAWDYRPAPRSSYGFRPCDIANYAHLYAAEQAEFVSDIAASRETLAYFRKRLADWVPPKTTQQSCAEIS